MIRVGAHMAKPRTREEIQERCASISAEVDSIVERSNKLITETVTGPLLFKYSISAPTPLLEDYEQAQTLCFIAKYLALPEMKQIVVGEKNGRFYPNNIDYYRHMLNEFRSVIQNENDSNHFSKINALCTRFLRRKPEQGLSLSVTCDGLDVSESYRRLLDQKAKAAREMVKACDFGYIYNGILQHSDHTHTARYMSDYASGELHYVFVRHALICDCIRDALRSHFSALANIQGVAMGPL